MFVFKAALQVSDHPIMIDKTFCFLADILLLPQKI